MGVNKYNSEGYYDPTTYEALTKISNEEKKKAYRPLVFICSPFAGDVEHNLENARRYSRFAVKQGAIPFAPHLLYPQILDDSDKAQRSTGIFFGLVIMGKCDQLWVFGSEVSSGMQTEISKAKKRGMPIRYFRAPRKSLDFLGRGEATKNANFRGYTEVSESEFALTSEELMP